MSFRKGERDLINAEINKDFIEDRIEYEFQMEKSYYSRGKKKSASKQPTFEERKRMKERRKAEERKAEARESAIMSFQNAVIEAIGAKEIKLPPVENWEMLDEEGSKCIICWDECQVSLNPVCELTCCGRYNKWHRDCLVSWREKAEAQEELFPSCPICRKVFFIE